MSDEGQSGAGGSDDTGDKTEEATPRRREKARERGEIPKSQEFSTAVALGAGLLLLATIGGTWAGQSVSRVWGRTGEIMSNPPANLSDISVYLRGVIGDLARALSVPLLGLSVAILLFHGLQARGTFAVSQLAWKFSKLNPIEGAKRLLKWDTLVELLKALLKFVVLGVAMWLAVRGLWASWFVLPPEGVAHIPEAMRDGTLRLMMFVVALFGVLAAGDYAWQSYQYHKKMRMSLYDVRKEAKDDQGDPTIRAWRRRFAQAQLQRLMLRSVRNADLLVTNPTHIAIALKVDEAIETPVVLAVGVDQFAQRLKKIAKEAGVPIVEERPLARALLDVSRVGEPVPPALYKAVGDVLAYVYRTTGKMPNWLKRRIEENSAK